MRETRLLSGETRPSEYERLLLRERAANDDVRAAFSRAYRRRHRVLATLAWFAEREWRMAILLGVALVLGTLAGLWLP